MGITIAFFALLLVACSFTVLYEINMECTLPCAMLSIILYIYILSLFNIFGYSMLIILFIGIFALTISAVIQYKKKKWNIMKFLERIITPGVFIFVVFSIFLYFYTKNIDVYHYDEFTHWVTTVKDMYYYDRLSVYPESVTHFKTYPPAMALWQYLFTNFETEYKDSIVIYAYNIYCVLMVLPFTKTISKKKHKILLTIIAFLFIFILPYIRYSPWESSPWDCAYIDNALSFTMSYALLVYFLDKDNSLLNQKYKVFNIMISLSVLSLLKSTGNVLTVFVLLIIATDIIFEKANRRINYKCLLMVILGWLFTYSSWAIFLKIKKVHNVWNSGGITLKRLMLLVRGEEEEWRYDIVTGFVNKLKENFSFYNGALGFSYISIVLLWIIIIVFFYLLHTKKEQEIIRKKYISISVVLIVEYIIFEISLLLTYLYVFTQEEAINYAGFSRYSSNYFLSITIFLLCYMWEVLSQNADSEIFSFLLLFIFVLNIVSLDKMKTNVFAHRESIEEAYSITGFAPYEHLEEKYKNIMNKDTQVLVVSDDFFASFITKKIFIPANTDCYNTSSFSEEFDISKYDYIYIDLDENNNDLISNIFNDNILMKGMYKYEKDELKLIDN